MTLCVFLCLWEINPSLVISLSDIARNESAVLFIALHRAAITSVPNALACDIDTLFSSQRAQGLIVPNIINDFRSFNITKFRTAYKNNIVGTFYYRFTLAMVREYPNRTA